MFRFPLSRFFPSFLVFPTNYIALFGLIGSLAAGRPAQSAASAGDSLKLKAGSFIEAVKKENLPLLEERIRERLGGPLDSFIEELYFAKADGRNVFHHLTEVKTKQKEFAAVMKGLIQLVYPSFFPKAPRAVTLASVTFRPEKSPTDSYIESAVNSGNPKRAVKRLYKESAALYALAYLHKTGGMGDLLLTALYRTRMKSFGPAPAPSKLTAGPADRGGGLKDSYVGQNGFEVFHLAKDHQGISPKELAVLNKNQPALDVLDKPEVDETSVLLARMGDSAVIGGGMGFLAGGAIDYIFSPYSLPIYTTIYGPALGAALGSLFGACQNLFLSEKTDRVSSGSRL